MRYVGRSILTQAPYDHIRTDSIKSFLSRNSNVGDVEGSLEFITTEVGMSVPVWVSGWMISIMIESLL